MPYKSQNAASTITESQLAPHLRGRGFGSAFASSSQQKYYLPAAEDIAAGDAVGLDLSGNAVVAGDSEVVAIAAADVLSGESLPLETYKAKSDRYDFEKGKIVWLSHSGDVNLTTDVPDFGLGDKVQRVGISTETDELILIIQPMREII